MGVTTVVKTASGTGLLINGVLFDPSGTSTIANFVFSGNSLDLNNAGTIALGTSVATGVQIGNAGICNSVTIGAIGYVDLLAPSVFVDRNILALGGAQLVNSPSLYLRAKYWAGGVGPSTNIDNYLINIADSTVPGSHIEMHVGGSAFSFFDYGSMSVSGSYVTSAGDFLTAAGHGLDTTGAGLLGVGTGTATQVNVGRAGSTSTNIYAKQVTFNGYDVANGATPFVFNTANTYTGNAALLSVQNAGGQKAAVDASGSIYVTAGQQLDTLSAGTLSLGQSNANNIVIGHNNGGPIQLNYGGTGGVVLTQGAGSGSPGSAFVLAAGAHTTLTASTEYIDFSINTNRVVQFNTGAIALQRAVRIQPPTYAFVGASIITDAVTLEVTGAPIQGTNTTITNTWAFRSLGNTVLKSSGGSGVIQVDDVIGIKAAYGTTGMTANGATISFGQNNATSSTPNMAVFTPGAHTTIASAECIDIAFNLNRTVQFNTGNLATQRAVVIQSPTYGFVGASTITNAATLAISGAPVQGTNATITNSYALWVQTGGVNFGQATVTQLTSLATGVTINGASGIITTFTAALAAGASTTFTVTNSACKAGSVVVVGLGAYSGSFGTSGSPSISVNSVAAGSFVVRVYNAHTANALNGTVQINFVVV